MLWGASKAVTGMQQEVSSRLFCELKPHPHFTDRTGSRNGNEFSSVGQNPSSTLQHYIIKIILSFPHTGSRDWVNSRPEIHSLQVKMAKIKDFLKFSLVWTSTMCYCSLVHSVIHSFKTKTH